MNQDQVFKALADANRRLLLDLLFHQDGQTLSELVSHLSMTRFGVMKHLKILEEAGLVSTRKIGREKFHYLNPVPIQLVYDRWVDKFARPWSRSLTNLKYTLEESPMNKKHTHVYEIFIQTTPERLWQALTDGSISQHYYFGTKVESDWTPGSRYRYVHAHEPDSAMIDGEIVECDPPRRLVQTFRPLFAAADAPAGFEPPLSKVTWEIEPMGDTCKLSLTHDDLEVDSPLTQGLISGWAQIMSGLKTLLETGEPMKMAEPAGM